MLTPARQELLENLAKLISEYESSTPTNNDVCCQISFFMESATYDYDGEKFAEN